MIKNGTIWRHQALVIFLFVNDSVVDVHVAARRINNHRRRPLFQIEIVVFVLRTVEEVARLKVGRFRDLFSGGDGRFDLLLEHGVLDKTGVLFGDGLDGGLLNDVGTRGGFVTF